MSDLQERYEEALADHIKTDRNAIDSLVDRLVFGTGHIEDHDDLARLVGFKELGDWIADFHADAVEHQHEQKADYARENGR